MNMIVDVRFIGGTSIDEAVSEALVFANNNACIVSFEFNGIDMLVQRMSDRFDKDIQFFVEMYYKKNDLRWKKEQKEHVYDNR